MGKKDIKHEEDTDFTDEQVGGDLTEEEFDDALYKAPRKLEDEGKDEGEKSSE